LRFREDMTPDDRPDDRTRQACAAGIEALAQWAATTRDVPRHVLQRAARVLADDLAAMVGARDEPQVAAFHARVLARAAGDEATVFRGGPRARTDRLSAAVANAVAGDWLELDEGYRVAPCHAGLYVMPALLAETEARDLPLQRMLHVVAIAYEVVTRVARAFSPRVLNLHSHARYAAVGACAATAMAAELDGATMRHALAAAATLINVGPRNHLISGTLVRNVWPAVGAWSGMMSVEWAQCGIAGSRDGFHDAYAGVLDSRVDPGALTQGLGQQWAILDGYTKVYACCQHLHSAVEAALALRARVPAVESIDAVVVEAHPLAQLLPNPEPQTTLGAKFSLPHAVAAALVKGSGGADAFASDTLGDAGIARLRERVRIEPYPDLPPPPDDRPARVRVRMCGGETLEAACASALGSPDRPLPPGMHESKIEALTARAYPRLPGVLESIVALEPARLARGWSDTVADFCP
jgi:2-methylcitrate dehydratase PrpD